MLFENDCPQLQGTLSDHSTHFLLTLSVHSFEYFSTEEEEEEKTDKTI